MKFKFNKNKAVDTAAVAGGTAVGFMVSRGIGKILPESAQNPLVKAGIALSAIVLASSVQGAETLANVTRGIVTGVAIENTASAAASAGKSLVKETPETNMDKFLNGALGMNAADALPVYQPINYQLLESSFNDDFKTEPITIETPLTGGFSQG